MASNYDSKVIVDVVAVFGTLHVVMCSYVALLASYAVPLQAGLGVLCFWALVVDVDAVVRCIVLDGVGFLTAFKRGLRIHPWSGCPCIRSCTVLGRLGVLSIRSSKARPSSSLAGLRAGRLEARLRRAVHLLERPSRSAGEVVRGAAAGTMAESCICVRRFSIESACV